MTLDNGGTRMAEEKLKPAHEVLCEKIAAELKEIHKIADEKMSPGLPVLRSEKHRRRVRISAHEGAIITCIEVLAEMKIPEASIPNVMEKLGGYRDEIVRDGAIFDRHLYEVFGSLMTQLSDRQSANAFVGDTADAAADE